MPRKRLSTTTHQKGGASALACLARWLDDTGFLNACSNAPEPGHLRCKWHLPDGSRIDRGGRPIVFTGEHASAADAS